MSTSPTLLPLTRAYLHERHARSEFSAETVRAVRYTLYNFAAHVGGIPAHRLTRRHVETWLSDDTLAAATLRARLTRLRMFCTWLVDQKLLKVDPTYGLKGPRRQRRLPRGLHNEDVQLTLDACPDRRGQLIVLLMVQEGLRCGEVSRLQVDDINTTERLMLVRGKGGHERALPITEETWAALGGYLAETGVKQGPVIRSQVRPGRGVSPQHVSDLVRGWMGSVNVAATAHALRHTCATDLLRSGVHLRDVQHALGHASLATTELYLPWVVGDLRTAMGGRKYGRVPDHSIP
jgi:integrase/recombinase XerD